MVFAQGAAGSKIFQGLRRLDIGNSNYQTKALSRWTGEGSSNDYPRLSSTDANGNFGRMSDFYLESGNYARLKVVQLGYSLPGKIYSKIGASRLRVYLTSENLLTLTKYTGYDPEIGGGVFGIDKVFVPVLSRAAIGSADRDGPKTERAVQGSSQQVLGIGRVFDGTNGWIAGGVDCFETLSGRQVPDANQTIVRGTADRGAVSVERNRSDWIGMGR